MDSRMWGLVRGNSNLMVPWYLMAAHAYYHLDEPLLSDGAFDGLAEHMLLVWDKIEHRHKDLIGEEDLESGSLLLAEEDFPGIVIGGTVCLLKELRLARRRVRIGGDDV